MQTELIMLIMAGLFPGRHLHVYMEFWDRKYFKNIAFFLQLQYTNIQASQTWHFAANSRSFSASALGHHYNKTFRMPTKVAFTETLQTLRGKITYIQQVYFFEDKSLASSYWRGSPVIILRLGDWPVPLAQRALLVSQGWPLLLAGWTLDSSGHGRRALLKKSSCLKPK